MPKNFNKILRYNYGEKSLKTPFVVYVDLECLLLKQQSCQNSSNELILNGKLYMNHMVIY